MFPGAVALTRLDAQTRLYERDFRDQEALQPHAKYMRRVLPPVATVDEPASAYAARFAHTSINKKRYPVNALAWMPDGRRLVTGAQSGEFTLWGGTAFNFVTLLQAHDQAVRCLTFSNDDDWLISADNSGKVGYWKSTMANFKMFAAHEQPVRCLTFAPTDLKFATGADDMLIKIWDFATQKMERELKGHNWDVRAADWHPQKSLLASGGKDAVVKMWDPRDAACVHTVYGHKNAILKVSWNKNGNWLLTSGRDQRMRLIDLRTLKEAQSWKSPRREITAVEWHPVIEDLFATGAYDGSMAQWRVGAPEPVCEVPLAHDATIWDMGWHPLGHVLATASYDNFTRFWSRHEPGDTTLCTYTRQRGPLEPADVSLLAEALGVSRETAVPPPQMAEAHNGEREASGLDLMRRMESGAGNGVGSGPGFHGDGRPGGKAPGAAAAGGAGGGGMYIPGISRPDEEAAAAPAARGATSLLGGGSGGVAGAGAFAGMSAVSSRGDRGGHDRGGDRDRGGRSRPPPPEGYTCNKCGIKGHWIEDCPTRQDRYGDRGGGGGGDRGGGGRSRGGQPPPGYVCHICNKPGHWRTDCPDAGTGGRKPPGPGYVCRKCNQPGHWMQDCPNAAGGGAAPRGGPPPGAAFGGHRGGYGGPAGMAPPGMPPAGMAPPAVPSGMGAPPPPPPPPRGGLLGAAPPGANAPVPPPREGSRWS